MPLARKVLEVAALSCADLHDIYKTRAHIETLALRLSIEQGNDAWEADMIAAYHRLVKFESVHEIQNIEDYKEWELRHRMYNLALINACGLTHLLRIQQQLYNLTERYRRQWLIEGMKQIDGLPYAKEQKKIMDAALARDVPLAIKLLYKHFEKAAAIIESYFIKNNLFRVSLTYSLARIFHQYPSRETAKAHETRRDLKSRQEHIEICDCRLF